MIIHEGHTGSVYSVAYSPDGKSVVSGSLDKTVRIWDALSSSPIGEPLIGHNGGIRSVSYSPLGNLIASGSEDETIRLWDPNTGQQSGEALKAYSSIHSVAFSPDAKFIASGSGGFFPASTAYAVQLWDEQMRKTASRPFKGHTSFVWSVSFSPDGAWVVSGSNDQTICIWDAKRGTTIVGPLQHTGVVYSISFSPDGAQILSCSSDGTIRFWDARTGGMIGEPYKGHIGQAYSAAFSPCGTYLASGGYDKTVRLWDTRTGRQVDQSFNEHTDAVRSVAYSPCGQYIASGSDDCKVIIRGASIDGPDSDDNPDSDVDLRPVQEITSQMSTREIFQCLVEAGCNDLSSTMDPRQDAARIMSGGGFGDIWKGELNDGTKVAIKAWRTDALEQFRYKTIKRAARELHCWSRMEHKNIHRLMGVIIFRDEYLGMVSEWMENGDLHKYLRSHPNASRYQLCIDVASGLEYMHEKGTVHGDLKAANVLVSADGIARISDFDFSVMSEASDLVFTASSNTRSGSIRWVAPEMLDEDVPKRTTQSDVYALGMTMLEIFTGRVPYPDRRLDAGVMRAVTQGILPARPVQYLEDDEQGSRVWNLLLECWGRKPSERPSAGKVVQVLVLYST